MIWAITAVGCVVAGIVQAVTGFGSVVFMMLFFPFFFDMIDAPALALVINQLYCMVLLWQYRHHVQWRIVLPPTILYSVINFVVAQFVGRFDLRGLTVALALFLMALSIYFLAVARRIKVKPHPAIGVGVGIFSGITAGFLPSAARLLLSTWSAPPMIIRAIKAACSSSSPSPASSIWRVAP